MITLVIGRFVPLDAAEQTNTDRFDSNGENTIIRLGANVGENERIVPEKRLKMGARGWVPKEERM